jgi:uncharacterized protein YjlB
MSDLRQAPTPEKIWFDSGDKIPNNPNLPILVYQDIFESQDPGSFVFQTVRGNNWGGCWEDGIFPYHHYHSTAHEALAVIRGEARVTLGGPQGRTVDVGRGDVVVLPAGVGHCRKKATDEFAVAGSYPPGQDWDLLRDLGSDKAAIMRSIEDVPIPETDPFYGSEGPLVEIWNESLTRDDHLG